jgi:uncharacterized protein (DUF1800 family)
MMDSTQATRCPVALTLAGKDYPIRQLSHSEWAPLQAWLKKSVPSPVAEAVRAIRELESADSRPSDPERSAIMANAHEQARLWPPRVGSQHWFDALNAIDGAPAMTIRAILAAGGTAVTDDEADAIFAEASVEEVGAMWAQALHGDAPSPKATTGTTDPTAAPSPTTGA